MNAPSRKPNRLANELSPYLLQHAHNPVDWYPWGSEALEKAARENKPIFLSVGYSACHWCHVMERESFEDSATAELLNRGFVNVKVDREERPDLDHIYMQAVQAMTQRGGWPMSVFLTPAGEPFFAGTYFPPQDRHGMPAFSRVIQGVLSAWQSRPEEVEKSAGQLVKALHDMEWVSPSDNRDPDPPGWLAAAAEKILQGFDTQHGGLGQAPKFFHSMAWQACLRHAFRAGDSTTLQAVLWTVKKIVRGGVYDHLGGGIHRYSTDAEWLAPHFEKMLYDNALVADLLLEAFQVSGDAEIRRAATATLDFVLREMQGPEGGFYSTQDADSEGEEGKFYVWTPEEVLEVLGADRGQSFCKIFDVTPEGNWEGKSILRLQKPLTEWASVLGISEPELLDEIAGSKRALFAARQKRVAPPTDDKVLVGWNGLMLFTLARAFMVLGDERYLDSAKRAAQFLCERLWDPKTQTLHRVYRKLREHEGVKNAGCLEDYAALSRGLWMLAQCPGGAKWVEPARAVTDSMCRQFWDQDIKGFYMTPLKYETLILRPRDFQDGATPSGTALAVSALALGGRFLGENTWIETAELVLSNHQQILQLAPMATGQFLIAKDFLEGSPAECVLIPGQDSEANEAVRAAIQRAFQPSAVFAWAGTGPKWAEQRPGDASGEPTVYWCQNFACKTPWVGLEAVKGGLARLYQERASQAQL